MAIFVSNDFRKFSAFIKCIKMAVSKYVSMHFSSYNLHLILHSCYPKGINILVIVALISDCFCSQNVDEKSYENFYKFFDKPCNK